MKIVLSLPRLGDFYIFKTGRGLVGSQQVKLNIFYTIIAIDVYRIVA